MAKLSSLIQFTGSLDDFSAFRMAGVKEVVLRRKGGASGQRILHDACFVNTRRNMGEFGGRGLATHHILLALQPLRPGHGTTGQLNKVLTAVQKRDTTASWGQRCVALSKCPQLLQGLNISKRLEWQDVVKGELSHAIDHQGLSALLEVPPLLPGVNCVHPKSYPFFRVMAVLGLMPDLYYDEQLGQYAPEAGFAPVGTVHVYTPWLPTARPADAYTLELALPRHPGVERFTLLLSAAVVYGRAGLDGEVDQAPGAVASRILAVG